MGELMGIRPIITLIDGKTKVEAKVRGDEKSCPPWWICARSAPGMWRILSI